MIGQLVGKYRITQPLGQGGMGVVFEAVHTELGQRAAVKLLRPEISTEPEMVRRFFNEARAVALVQHPGLVKIFDFGRLPGGPLYILMEYLEGEPLRARLRRRGGGLPMGEALRLARQIASTLHTTHQKGIVHRDLKPDNVIIVLDPEATKGERVKLLDFGIAKILTSGEAGGEADVRTRPGAILGSPRYMAPEQWRGEAISDRADVYALGVMLHEMLTGQPPFEASQAGELLMQHLNRPPRPLREILPGLPEAASALVLRMLAKEPLERPAMGEVAAILEAQFAPPHTVELGPPVGQDATLPLTAGPEARHAAPSDTQASPASPVAPAVLETDSRAGLPQPSRLEQLVEQDLQRQRPPPLATAAGPVPLLSPKKFQDIMTAFLLYQGERFWLPGVVLRQRGISVSEAGALSTACGVGARFLIGQKVDPSADPGGEPFYVTVYTVLPGHTRALQEHLESRHPVSLVVRVLAPTGMTAAPQGFVGFHMYGSQNPHPWTLVADELLTT